MSARIGRWSRRDVLARTGAAAGCLAAPAVIPAIALGADGRPAPSERVRLGHIGLGDRGPNHYGIGGKDVEHVAVCDTWKNRREAGAKRLNCTAHADFRELLARGDIDGVVIAVPDHWHVPMAIAAAKAKKDIFLEKAVGTSVSEDLALREAIKTNARVFQYGPQRRAMGNYRRACELVRGKKIGELREIHVTAATFGPCAPRNGYKPAPAPPDLEYDLWLGPAPEVPYVPGRCQARGWYCIYDYCIGWISAWGSHVLSIAQWAYDTHRAGTIVVEATGTIPRDGLNDNLTQWDATLRFANGVLMTFKTGQNGVKFVGSEGWVEVNDRGQKAEPKELWTAEPKDGEVRLPAVSSLGDDFVRCIRTRKQTVSPIDDAVYSDILSHLADIAVRAGRKITWDPVKEQIVGDETAARMLSRSLRAPWKV